MEMGIQQLTEHWLSIGAGIFLLGMVLYGHYRGFVKQAVTMGALVISILVVHTAMPYVSAALRQNTGIHQAIGQGLLHLAGGEEAETGTAELPDEQRTAIEQLKLPEQMKEILLENNNHEIYRLLGVDAFLDYLGAYLADMVINLVGAVLLFILVFLLIRFLAVWLDLVARLPILSGMNQLAGAALGGVEGLLLLWVAGLIVSFCGQMDWAQTVQGQIEGSVWLSFLYRNNLFHWLFISIINSFI